MQHKHIIHGNNMDIKIGRTRGFSSVFSFLVRRGTAQRPKMSTKQSVAEVVRLGRLQSNQIYSCGNFKLSMGK